MNPSVATLVYSFGIAALFFFGRDKTIRTSGALWIPVVYVWIIGSRSPSIWLGIAPAASTEAAQLDGTPLDRAIYTLLLLVGIIVLFQRGRKVVSILAANWAILAYFAFCLASVVWSDFPDVAAKRWIKAIGDLVMALIVVTDTNPIGAFKRLVSRVGFLLVPASILLIKYYPLLGRAYDPWVGTQFNIGVTTNKNTLGVVVLVISLGSLWYLIDLIRSKEQPNRRRLLMAVGSLLVLGMMLLAQADSATSKGSFALGAALLIVTSLPALRRHPRVVHSLVVMILLAGGFATMLGGTGGIAHTMGRNGDLTGRTEIWAALLPMATHPMIGAGFETFWLGDRVVRIRAEFEGNRLNEAHNGYLEVFLNLGWIGLGLLALVLISGYREAAKAVRRNPMFGNLPLAYIVSALIYSVTEAGFRLLDPIWFFLLLAIVAATAVTLRAGSAAKEGPRTVPHSPIASRLASRVELCRSGS